MRFSIALSALGFFSAVSSALAAPVDQAASGKRLISLSETETKWLTEEEIFALYKQRKHFIDITDADDTASFARLDDSAITAVPIGPNKQSIVTPLISAISEDAMQQWLTTLTQFHTRYYKSTTGKQASDYIFNQASAKATAANQANKGLNVTVTKFTHSWTQYSIIARVAAANTAQAADPVVVLSSHMDSINSNNPTSGRAPGADDDGSGSVTIFETYRILLENNIVPNVPIEFHWYAAEEAGLLGSQAVVKSFTAAGRKVAGTLQLDMTGYTPKGKQAIVGIATDYVNAPLSKYLQSLAKAYCAIPWGNVKCGYGCSDHASWTKAGFPATFAFESSFSDSSPYIHTDKDTLATVSYAHMKEFTKLAIGFAVELSLNTTP
ncbi:Leucine aminopeptidase 1 [Gaertneriomyces sp. JEL0708]|nr:Leucine aminopeptidase 1 [Gaertneriomyces sp. JEL0708]